MVLLQSAKCVTVRRYQVNSPADAADDGRRTQPAQKRTARFFLARTRRPEFAAVFVSLAGPRAPIVLVTLLRHAPNLTQFPQKYNKQNFLG